MDYDLLIENVDIVSPGDAVRRGHSVAVAGETIADIQPAAVLQGRTAGRRIDGRGGLCSPGFVNVHNHTPLMAVRGMFEDRGFAPAYTKGVPQGHWLGDAETFALARLGLAEMLLQGCTSVVDFYARPQALAAAMAETGLRGYIGGRIMDVDTAALAEGKVVADPALGERTLADSLALFDAWHGAGDGRIQCILAPHAPDTCSPALMRSVADIAARDDIRVHTHLAQSPLEATRVQAAYGRSPTELLDENGLLNARLTAAHCIAVSDDDIARIARSGAFVAHVPVGNATGGQSAPIEALHAAGAPIALSTDSKSGCMLDAMRMALRVARIRAGGRLVFDAATAFAWGTVGGAASLGHGAVLGRIRPGCLADIVLFDPEAPNLRPVVDGVGVLVHSGSGFNVQTVIVGGEILVEDRRPVRYDLSAVIREAQDVADALWARVQAG